MKFREYKSNYLSTKMNQYEQVAIEVNKVIEECKIEECEQGFELVKEMIINNEKLPFHVSLISALKEYFAGVGKWFATFISFSLGLLTTLISEKEDIVITPFFWMLVLVVFLLGYAFDALIEICNIKQDKLHIRILKEMKFNRYKFLIDNYKSKVKDKKV